ncbi:MAG: hypothetical protein AAF409_11215 [Pseudomonadota bacterium]
MTKLFLAPLVLAAVVLSGCADCSRDPSQVGLGCATANLTTGVYEEDDAKIRREIAALEARRSLLEEEATRYRADANRLRGERQAYARRVAALTFETATLNRQVADLNSRADVNRQQLAQLRAQERDLSTQVLDLSERGDPGDAAEVERLNARIAALQTQIRQIAQAS